MIAAITLGCYLASMVFVAIELRRAPVMAAEDEDQAASSPSRFVVVEPGVCVRYVGHRVGRLPHSARLHRVRQRIPGRTPVAKARLLQAAG